MPRPIWIRLGGQLLLAMLLLPAGVSVSFAQEDPCAKQESKPGPVTPDRIKQRAQSIRELKQLIADADPTVRLSALDTMLNSCDVAAREIAYDVAFNSGDQTMRSLAFKHRVLTLSQIVVEIVPPESPNAEQKDLMNCCLRLTFKIEKRNMATGEFSGYATVGSVSGFDLTATLSDVALRLRLQDGGQAEGTLSRRGLGMPARLVLR